MTNEKMKDLLVFLTNKTKERQLVWKPTDGLDKKVFMIDDSYFIGDGYFLEGFLDTSDKFHIHLDVNSIGDMDEEMEFDYEIDEQTSENSDVIKVFRDFEAVVYENAKQTEEECENAMINLITKNEWVKDLDINTNIEK